jgi:hypothetical protein
LHLAARTKFLRRYSPTKFADGLCRSTIEAALRCARVSRQLSGPTPVIQHRTSTPDFLLLWSARTKAGQIISTLDLHNPRLHSRLRPLVRAILRQSQNNNGRHIASRRQHSPMSSRYMCQLWNQAICLSIYVFNTRPPSHCNEHLINPGRHSRLCHYSVGSPITPLPFSSSNHVY